MALRFTPTLGICAIGAAVTAALLALPAAESAAPAVPAASVPVPVTGVPAAGTAVAASGAAPVAIEIADFSFGGSRTATVGAAVQVTNADGVTHTLTAADGAFDTGQVDGGSTVSFTAPDAPGTYDYFCAIHPSMTGSLVVN